MLFDLLTPDFARGWTFWRLVFDVMIIWLIGRSIRGFIEFICTAGVVAVFDFTTMIIKTSVHFTYMIVAFVHWLKDQLTGGKDVFVIRKRNAEYHLKIAYIPNPQRRKDLENILSFAKSNRDMNKFDNALDAFIYAYREKKDLSKIDFSCETRKRLEELDAFSLV